MPVAPPSMPDNPGAAAQTRMVSAAEIRLDSRKSVRPFKRIICDDTSEFESYMPSHAVGLHELTCASTQFLHGQIFCTSPCKNLRLSRSSPPIAGRPIAIPIAAATLALGEEIARVFADRLRIDGGPSPADFLVALNASPTARSPVAGTVDAVKPLHAQWPSSDEPRVSR